MSRARPVRRLLLVLVLLAATIALARALLGWFAADLFVAVVREAARGGGLGIRVDGTPSVTLSGFEAGGVTLLDADGGEVLHAEVVSGTVAWLLHRPWVGLSLALRDVRLPLSEAGFGSDAAAQPHAPLLPELPEQLASVSLERARLELAGGRTLSLDADLDFDGGIAAQVRRLDYEDASAGIAAEKLAGTLRLRPAAANASASAKGEAWVVEIAVGAGTALVGPVLLDPGSHPARASGRLERNADGAFAISGAAAELGRLVRASGAIRWTKDGAISSADGTLASEAIGDAFATLIAEPFAGLVPPLAETSLSGRAELAMRFADPSPASVVATLTLWLPSLAAPGVEASRLEAVLPWSGRSVGKGPPREGRLGAGALSLAGLAWSGVGAPLSSVPGRLRTTAAQEWKSEAGTLRLTDLVVVEDAAGLRLEAGVDRLDLDLARLGAAAGVEGLEGRVASGPSRLRLDADALRSDAVLVASTFGGTVELSNLSVEHPFRRVPEVGLDARLEDIDLSSLTAWLGAGRVTGVLEGHVRGLVIADGQPQALDADLHTVERRGVPQYVDVRAIVQLGVLGGGDSGSLTGTLLKFVDRYRYSKLGLRCRLRNDVFEVHGVETRGGRDYIIKGSLLPPSVSVVSHSQVVSFSEMLRRIQTITAVEEGGTPDAEP